MTDKEFKEVTDKELQDLFLRDCLNLEDWQDVSAPLWVIDLAEKMVSAGWIKKP